jgi:hypothetical protein
LCKELCVDSENNDWFIIARNDIVAVENMACSKRRSLPISDYCAKQQRIGNEGSTTKLNQNRALLRAISYRDQADE